VRSGILGFIGGFIGGALLAGYVIVILKIVL